MYFKTHPDFGHRPFVIPGDKFDGLPYIMSLAPQNDKLKFEWVDLKDKSLSSCTAFLSYDGMEYTSIEIHSNTAIIDVIPEKDCFLYIQVADGRKSFPRPFRSGYFPGTVVNYLNPLDDQYDFTGRYLGSPCLIKTKKGTMYASNDIMAANTAQNFGQVFRSDDDGKTWSFVADLYPAMWPTLLEHNDKLYAIAASKEFGNLEVLESLDEGKTWHGITLAYGNCQWRDMGWHKSPMPVVKYNGRLWTAIEYGTWNKQKFMMTVMSIDENADFMNIENWTIAQAYTLDKDLPGAENAWGGIEGNVLVTPEGELVSIIRHGYTKAIMLSIDKDNPAAPLQFKQFVDFPMAYTKFHILQEGDVYYALGNPSPFRNVLDLYTSKDLKTWTKQKTLLDLSHLPAKLTGIQNPYFFIEGNKFKTLLRVAYNGADTFHNSNCISYFEFDKN